MLDLTDWENKKYQTRDGRPVRILCIDGPGSWPVIGCVGEGLARWSLFGRFSRGYSEEDSSLINAKTKREGWVNIYDREHDGCCVLHDTKEDADHSAGDRRTACVHVEWEE